MFTRVPIHTGCVFFPPSLCRDLNSMSVAFSRNPFVARHYRRKTCYPPPPIPRLIHLLAHLLSPLKFRNDDIPATRIFHARVDFPLSLHYTLRQILACQQCSLNVCNRRISIFETTSPRNLFLPSILQNGKQGNRVRG